jgi:hypothetical protein
MLNKYIKGNILMGTVVKFPDSNERVVAELHALLDELIVGHAPEFVDCLKKRITPVYMRLAKMPEYQFSLSIHADDEKKTFDEIKKHIKEYAEMVQAPLLHEIVMMLAEQCHDECYKGYEPSGSE